MYTERYVTFADILGFTDIVKQSVQDSSVKRQEALAKALREAASYHPGLNDSDDIQFQSFSDSIVMSSASTITGLLHILSSMVDLYIRLLREGLLIRGAVAKGSLHHEGPIMFGPAFLEAYSVEDRIAKYPRIVLSRKVHEDFQKISGGLKFPQILLAEDGPPFLHIFSNLAMFNETEPTTDLLNSSEVLEAHRCQRSIQDLLDASIYEPSHYEKLRWLAIYWNSTVGFIGARRALEPVRLPVSPQLELAKLRSSRREDLKGKDAELTAKLRAFSGTQFDAGIGLGDGEQADFIWDLEAILASAGWQQLNWLSTVLGPNIVVHRGNSGRCVLGNVSAQNVEIHLHPNSRSALTPAANALISALTSVGVAASVAGYNIRNGNDTAVHIVIGPKR
jgi:hypothetical protein